MYEKSNYAKIVMILGTVILLRPQSHPEKGKMSPSQNPFSSSIFQFVDPQKNAFKTLDKKRF